MPVWPTIIRERRRTAFVEDFLIIRFNLTCIGLIGHITAAELLRDVVSGGDGK